MIVGWVVGALGSLFGSTLLPASLGSLGGSQAPNEGVILHRQACSSATSERSFSWRSLSPSASSARGKITSTSPNLSSSSSSTSSPKAGTKSAGPTGEGTSTKDSSTPGAAALAEQGLDESSTTTNRGQLQEQRGQNNTTTPSTSSSTKDDAKPPATYVTNEEKHIAVEQSEIEKHFYMEDVEPGSILRAKDAAMVEVAGFPLIGEQRVASTGSGIVRFQGNCYVDQNDMDPTWRAVKLSKLPEGFRLFINPRSVPRERPVPAHKGMSAGEGAGEILRIAPELFVHPITDEHYVIVQIKEPSAWEELSRYMSFKVVLLGDTTRLILMGALTISGIAAFGGGNDEQ
ncbi:unnamed protein product [Amoebophrya sp. A25]|nr:unnamed protein product [Amoebophrya sp. A25]|eukprot:GSA25T00000165001.1